MRDAIDTVLEYWNTDGEFRSAFRHDAKRALNVRGIELDDEEWVVVKALGITTSPIRALDPSVLESASFDRCC